MTEVIPYQKRKSSSSSKEDVEKNLHRSPNVAFVQFSL